MARFALLVLAACAAAPETAQSSDLAVAARIGPQSFLHGTVRGAPLAYLFHGAKADVIAPDVWPTGRSTLQPTLTLLDARRNVIAHGKPRGADPRHLAIDGIKLPEAGDYFIAVGGDRGQFTLRLWMQSSHLPREEESQVDLTTTPSAAMLAAMESHQNPPRPWTDAEVDALSRGIEQEPDLRVALSDAHLLLWLVAPAQSARPRAAAARLVGTPQHFRSLDPALQAFALWWLGNQAGLLFESGDLPAPQAVADRIARLVAAWPGAKEDCAARRVQAKTLNGAVYGWQGDWSALQTDYDGRQVWIDFATEWFDAKGGYLGEQTAGASEPDDD
jgi:hypothetical protein